MPENYRVILDGCGGSLMILGHRDRWRLIQGWRERFAVGLHAAIGKWKLDGYEWHVFSFGYARALNGLQAVAEYQDQSERSFIICPERESLPAARVTDGRLPDFRPAGDDVYVWPEDLGWSMAFTHEESMGLGPYFSKREWVTASAQQLDA